MSISSFKDNTHIYNYMYTYISIFIKLNLYSYQISDNFLTSLITQKIFLKKALFSRGWENKMLG